MQIWRSLDQVPGDLGPTAVVIGNFDGVHLGHRHVVARARELAADRDLTVVAVTFDPHPMAVLRPEHAPTTLTSLEVRADLVAWLDARIDRTPGPVRDVDGEVVGTHDGAAVRSAPPAWPCRALARSCR